VDRREVAAEARRRFGPVLALAVFREAGLLTRVLHPGEPIDALALGRLRGGGLAGSQRLVVATPFRLLLAAKGLLSGRERLREIAWDAVAGVELTPPMALDLVLPGERIELRWMQPPREVAALADLVRARLDPERAGTPTTAELLDLARRKLGRLVASGTEACTMALAGLLEPDETVLELVFASGSAGDGLLAATPARLVFVPSRGLGAGEPLALPYAELVECAIEEAGGLVVATAAGERLVVESATPVERALTVAQIARARMPAPG